MLAPRSSRPRYAPLLSNDPVREPGYSTSVLLSFRAPHPRNGKSSIPILRERLPLSSGRHEITAGCLAGVSVGGPILPLCIQSVSAKAPPVTLTAVRLLRSTHERRCFSPAPTSAVTALTQQCSACAGFCLVPPRRPITQSAVTLKCSEKKRAPNC